MKKTLSIVFNSLLVFGVVFYFIAPSIIEAEKNRTLASASQVKEKKENKKENFSYAPGEILVKFKPGINPSEKEPAATLGENLKIGMWQSIVKGKSAPKLNIYKKKVADGSEGELIKKLMQDPDIEYAERNFIYRTEMAPNDPYYSSRGSWGQNFDDLWGIKKIQPEPAWDLTRGAGVKVAVVDSGVDYNHEDLASNIWHNLGETGEGKEANGIDDDSNGYIDDWRGWDTSTIITESQGFGDKIIGSKEPDNDPLDDNGHGTHAAGTIAAVANNNLGVVGIAPESQIMPVKFLTKTGLGTADDAANALIYAADNGADVINASWGGYYSQTIHEAIRYAYQAGAVIVASAGNSNADNWSHAPSGFAEVISVGATDTTDSKASFSSFGKVDLVAPGVDILSTKSSLDDSTYQIIGQNYKVLSGTSMSSPHVAGLAALLFSKNPALNNEEVRQLLLKSADDLGSSSFDNIFGFGRINVQKALNENRIGQALIISPEGRIDSPQVEITGLVQSVNFSEYMLEYGAGENPATWTEIGRCSTIPQNNILGSWNLGDLSFGFYTLKLSLIDTAGNIFEHRKRVDYNSPLEISNIQVNTFSPSETIISWDINREVFSYLEYGLNQNLGHKACSDSDIDTSHIVQLLELEPTNTYYFRIIAEEFAHQIESQEMTFTTPAPVFSISNISVNPEPHRATITWQTDIPTTGLIQYNDTYWQRDLYYLYRTEITDANLSTSHSATIENLDDNQEYIFIIKSEDEIANGATTLKDFFTTPLGQYPQVTNYSMNNLTENSVEFIWDTDIPSTSEIILGGHHERQWIPTLTVNDPMLSTHHKVTAVGLWPTVDYTHPQINSTSSDGSESYYALPDFRTPATTHISNISVTPFDASAAISWQTDIPAESYVWYWIDPLPYYMSSPYVAEYNLAFSHNLTINNLVPETTYQYKIKSVTSDNQYLITEVGSFTTTAYQSDVEAPTGSIKINNDAAYSDTIDVALNLSAVDNRAVTQMQFSNDGQNFSEWEPYAIAKPWNLSFGEGEKQVFVRFKDAAENVSVSYADSIIVDYTSPSGTITINNNAPYTHSQNVTLNLSAADNLSGLLSMRFSNDNVNWTAWEPYNTSKSLTLSSGSAEKTVYVQYKDRAANISSSFSDKIVLDDVAPTGSIVINNGASTTRSQSVRLTLSASDNLSGVAYMQFSNDNINWQPWVMYASSYSWTLTSGNGTKYVYVKFQDGAGNASAVYSDSIYLQKKK